MLIVKRAFFEKVTEIKTLLEYPFTLKIYLISADHACDLGGVRLIRITLRFN
tara:strand:- start:454 stop:609 length:156 start_codon:yes stop_codon:yes gene_type:complete